MYPELYLAGRFQPRITPERTRPRFPRRRPRQARTTRLRAGCRSTRAHTWRTPTRRIPATLPAASRSFPADRVGADRECVRHVGVPDAVADDLRVYASVQRHRGVGVTNVVQRPFSRFWRYAVWSA
jgi:hypothetical protein